MTVINTMAENYMNVLSQRATGAARRKVVEHYFSPVNFVLQPIAMETVGPLNDAGLKFVSERSRCMQETSGDQ